MVVTPQGVSRLLIQQLFSLYGAWIVHSNFDKNRKVLMVHSIFCEKWKSNAPANILWSLHPRGYLVCLFWSEGHKIWYLEDQNRAGLSRSERWGRERVGKLGNYLCLSTSSKSLVSKGIKINILVLRLICRSSTRSRSPLNLNLSSNGYFLIWIPAWKGKS